MNESYKVNSAARTYCRAAEIWDLQPENTDIVWS